MRSGAYSPRKVGPLAEEKLAELLAADWIPERVKGPDCRGDLQKLALLRARAELLWAEVNSMDLDEMTRPRRAGAGAASPVEMWQEAQARAGRLQERLGLDPLDLLEEERQAEQEAGIERLAERGAEIIARRFGPGGPPG